MSISRYFTEAEYLPKLLPSFRARPGQSEAAEFIFKGMDDYFPAAVEAPTGSGKTLSYLIPAFELERRVVISTKTKQLMSQILNKDIETVRKLFGREVDVHHLKGRRNYICHNRYFRHIHSSPDFYPDVIDWFESVQGEYIIEVPYSSFGGEIIERMTADSYQCMGSNCSFHSVCSFYRARELANAADIVVTNHHLIASDIALKSESEHASVLEFADHIIFDEAHGLIDIFPLFAGSEINLRNFLGLITENKTEFSPKEIDAAKASYNALLMDTRESRSRYEERKDDIDRFLNTAFAMLEGVKETEVADTFKKLKKKLEPISKGEDGVKFVDAGPGSVSVKYIPFTAGEIFRKGIKNSCLSPVFISATLTAGESFGYFLNELGYHKEEVRTKRMGAVFDFAEKGRLFVPRGVTPDNGGADGLYLSLASRVEGSLLIICNSLRRVGELEELFSSHLPDKKLFVQGSSDVYGKEAREGGIFIGCNVFREGVDFAHTGLSCVILDKLPFEYPDDVYLREKADRVQAEKGSGFMHFFLPRAVIYFKQAVGRLLRHEDDMGLWVVLDGRLLSKSYGKAFLDALDGVERVRSLNDAIRFLEECDEQNKDRL
ncbi:ATP-dependent DNA helicase [Limisalsivibrio acetivorans]|uniref:ATP-dependent DNA helicase n=1 Tax=Limisalsivibrio acetivorans TaxID=1304888 RepID=UPI0003B799CD|nr:ATP-dependent DNA helicase [Limisalsivibrio acetivorans]